MVTTIKVGMRGTVTLPKDFRKKFAIRGESLLIAEDTKSGILLKPAAVYPIENYSDDRLDEFEKNNNASIQKFFSKRKRQSKRA